MTTTLEDLQIYAIPGLGTDWRIFSRLERFVPLRYLEWLEPESEESLQAYAARMAVAIQGDKVCLLGVSFGGVVAQEIARLRNIERLVIISGIKDPREKPFFLRLFQRLPLYQLSRGSWRVATLPFWGPLFGVRRREEQRLLQTIFKGFSDQYRMWAIRSLANWEGPRPSVPFLHIHGTRDKVFPIRRISGVTPVAGGTHFTVYQDAEQVYRYLDTWVKQ